LFLSCPPNAGAPGYIGDSKALDLRLAGVDDAACTVAS
jgi:hypothetical protein